MKPPKKPVFKLPKDWPKHFSFLRSVHPGGGHRVLVFNDLNKCMIGEGYSADSMVEAHDRAVAYIMKRVSKSHA